MEAQRVENAAVMCVSVRRENLQYGGTTIPMVSLPLCVTLENLQTQMSCPGHTSIVKGRRLTRENVTVGAM